MHKMTNLVVAFSLTRQFQKRRQATISAVKSWLAHCFCLLLHYKKGRVKTTVNSISCLLFTKSSWTSPLEFSLFTRDFSTKCPPIRIQFQFRINFSLTWKDSFFNYFSCYSFQLWFSWTKPYALFILLHYERTFFVMTSFFSCCHFP